MTARADMTMEAATLTLFVNCNAWFRPLQLQVATVPRHQNRPGFFSII